MSTQLSVVIPSRDRAESLLRTLRSLATTDAAGLLEVVVVDDGDGSGPVPAATEERWPFPLTVERSHGEGLNAAREVGIAASAAAVVAFLDDDVTVDPGWVTGALAAMEDERGLAGVAGRTLPADPGAIPAWVSPEKLMYLSVLDLGEEPREFGPRASPVGANLILRRSWIERVGGFRPGLDRIGSSLISGGDTELCARIAAAGGRVVYWPAAAVRHHLDPARLTRRWFRRRARAQGVSDALIRYPGGPAPRDYAFELVRPLRAGGIAAKRLRDRRPLFDAELWLWSSAGRWSGLAMSRRRRTVPEAGVER